MIIYELARALKHKIREYKKSRDCKYITPVRRIERVYPIKGERLCAMTFDDGPSDIETNPKVSELGLTEELLRVMREYGAHGTFDVIGTTEYNYPDEAGEEGFFTWGGVKYDHYPDINKDTRAGAKNRPDLIRKLLSDGHEISNHGYRHILFGKMKLIYGARACFSNIHEVVSDAMELDNLMLSEHGYKMRLARPPHYVDKIPDGKTSYDAYRYAGYNYMAASFDGGGWLPSCGDTEKDVEKMVEPIRTVLSENPDALNGQIIFQKDGYSMSRHTPVAEALPRQLEILKEYGYKVVSVSELLEKSAFEDCENEDATYLASKGYTVAYKNNTLKPERKLTFGELVTICTPPEGVLKLYREFVDSKYDTKNLPYRAVKKYGISEKHPYFIAFCHAAELGLIDKENKKKLTFKTVVSDKLFCEFLQKINPDYKCDVKKGAVLRKDAFYHIRRCIMK